MNAPNGTTLAATAAPQRSLLVAEGAEPERVEAAGVVREVGA